MTVSSLSKKAIFLFYGDVIKSYGTATYLSSLLKYVGNTWDHVEALFFQIHLSNADSSLKGLGIPGLSKAPLTALYPHAPKLIWRIYEVLYCYVRLCHRLLQGKDASQRIVFVCGEALLPLVLFCRVMGYRCVYVKMGIIEEFSYGAGGLTFLKYRMIRILEGHCLKRFDAITVVSKGMGQYLQLTENASQGGIIVLPCAVDQEIFRYRPDTRPEIRRDLGLENRLVFVYSGIWAPWQCVQETIACFKLLKALDERAFLLILSPDKDLFHQFLSGINPEDYRVLFVEHSFIDRYLSSADCGFLIRKRHIINRVASPLKFSEYLICGLPVIIGPEVGDFSGFVRDHGTGVVIDPDRPDEWKYQLLPFMRQIEVDQENIKKACIHLAVNGFSWQVISSRLEQLRDLLASQEVHHMGHAIL